MAIKMAITASLWPHWNITDNNIFSSRHYESASNFELIKVGGGRRCHKPIGNSAFKGQLRRQFQSTFLPKAKETRRLTQQGTPQKKCNSQFFPLFFSF